MNYTLVHVLLLVDISVGCHLISPVALTDTNKMPKTDKLQMYNPATQRVHASYTLPVQEVPSSDVVSYLHSGRRMAQPKGCPDEL